MNFFHAWQYFGLVWWSERGNLRRPVGPSRCAGAGAAALAMMLLAAEAYGVWAELGRLERAAAGAVRSRWSCR